MRPNDQVKKELAWPQGGQHLRTIAMESPVWRQATATVRQESAGMQGAAAAKVCVLVPTARPCGGEPLLRHEPPTTTRTRLFRLNFELAAWGRVRWDDVGA